MNAVRLILSAMVAVAIALPAYGYFTLRLAGDSSGGSAFHSAYAADIVVVAATLAVTIGVLVALIHDRGRFRTLLLAASLVLLSGSVLSMRELQYAWGAESVRDSWPIAPLSRTFTVGGGETTCIKADTFTVEITNPDSEQKLSVFRGVWPWSFDAAELDDLLPAC